MDIEPDRRDRLEITLVGPVATSALATLAERYDQVSASRVSGADAVVTVVGVDTAGERAVLNLLWDTGHQVRSLVRRRA